MPTDDAANYRKHFQYLGVYSSSINALHTAYDALSRNNFADAEFQFNLVANALANAIGKEVTP